MINTTILELRNVSISITISVFALVMAFSCKPEKTNVEPVRPNVVFILADDLGLNDLGITGSDYYETPHIDQIAKDGAVFTQGYAASRVCSPSRASILLGQFTARHGITDWIGAKSGTDWRAMGRNDKLLPADYVHNLPKVETTLAEAFKNNGYTTFFDGKWHLGGEGSWPTDHGFDINKGGWHVGSPIGGYFSPWENPNLENTTKGENLSMRLAQETSDFIQQHRDSAFFAYLSFYAVHGPIQTSQEKWRKYRDKAEANGIAESGYSMERVLPIRTVQDNPIYAGLVEQMDDAIGLVLEKLKELGLEDNTIIIFTSDNGGVASGDAFSTTNLPLRGGKGYQWEGGIREPYFIKVPGLVKQKSIAYPVTGADLYPTILDLAGIPLNPDHHRDGVSLKPLLEGNSLPERPLFWHYPHYGNQGGEPSSIIRLGPWKLIHYWEDGRDELYDLNLDPSERNDVSSQNKETAEALKNRLLNFLNKMEAHLPSVDENFDVVLEKANYLRNRNVMLPRLEEQRKQFLAEDFSPGNDWWGSAMTKD